MTGQRIFLMLSAAVWLPYGIYCFFQPAFLAEAAGVNATSATGTTELRAMYGGLQMAIGGLALAALMRPALAQGVLITLAVLTAGLGTARLGGVVLDGGISGYTIGGLLFEMLGATLAFVLASRATTAPH